MGIAGARSGSRARAGASAHALLASGAALLMIAGAVVSFAGKAAPTAARSSGRPRARAGAPQPTIPPPVPPPSSDAPPPVSPAALAKLRSGAAAALAGFPSCLIVRDGSSEPLAANPYLPLAPASTQKLLVAAAALSVLGPDHRFHTTVEGSGRIAGGAVGQLWLVGGGDPMLATPAYARWAATTARYRSAPETPLAALAEQLRSRGLTRVTGGVHGDADHYDTPHYLSAWKPSEIAEGDVGPLSALSLDDGLQEWQPLAVAAPDPGMYAAASLAALLQAGHVRAVAGPDSAPPQAAVTLASVSSAPLSEIVAYMLTASDDNTAELLTLALGRAVAGAGTTGAGTTAVLHADARLGIPTAGVGLLDGSGLAPGDRATCASLLGALEAGSLPRLNAIISGLPVAGETGEMAGRFGGTALQGHLHAKTGWIDGVASMVGTLDLGRPIAFALIVNGLPPYYGATLDVENRVLGVLDAYDSAPARTPSG